jgi:hypothetical protein
VLHLIIDSAEPNKKINNCEITINQNSTSVKPHSFAGGINWYKLKRNSFRIESTSPECAPSIAKIETKNEIAALSSVRKFISLPGHKDLVFKPFTLNEIRDGFFIPIDDNKKFIVQKPDWYTDFCKSQTNCPLLIAARRSYGPFNLKGTSKNQGYAEFFYSKDDENKITDGVKGYFLVIYTTLTELSEYAHIEHLQANPLVISFE